MPVVEREDGRSVGATSATLGVRACLVCTRRANSARGSDRPSRRRRQTRCPPRPAAGPLTDPLSSHRRRVVDALDQRFALYRPFDPLSASHLSPMVVWWSRARAQSTRVADRRSDRGGDCCRLIAPVFPERSLSPGFTQVTQIEEP